MGSIGKIFRSPFVSGVAGPTGIFKPWDTPIGKILPKEMLGVASNIEPKQAPTKQAPTKQIKPKRPRNKVNTGSTILVDEEDYGI